MRTRMDGFNYDVMGAVSQSLSACLVPCVCVCGADRMAERPSSPSLSFIALLFWGATPLFPLSPLLSTPLFSLPISLTEINIYKDQVGYFYASKTPNLGQHLLFLTH